MSHRVQYLIAQLEWVTAQANHDMNKFGEWQCDYRDFAGSIQKELDEILGKKSKPETHPKDGELWLVSPKGTGLDYKYAVWCYGNRWFYRSDRTSEAIQILTPIKRLIPPEDEA